MIAGTPYMIAGTPTVIAGTPRVPVLWQMGLDILEMIESLKTVFCTFLHVGIASSLSCLVSMLIADLLRNSSLLASP